MKEIKYSWYARNCCPNIGKKRIGKILRTLVIISNILYWFAGCAILSISIWLRFVDVGAKRYFSTFQPFDTALYVILVASILFLVASFVGTCAANTKNEMMISLYIIVLFVVSVAEIISLIVYSSSHLEIEEDFSKWYKNHFENYQSQDLVHKEVVNHVQSKMKCCGMSGPRDFLVVFGNESIPNSCVIQIKIAEDIFRPEVYKTGCMQKLSELVDWLLDGWSIPFTATIILLLQVVGIITSGMFLQHIIYRRNFKYDDDDSAGLLNSEQNFLDPNHPLAKQSGKMSVDDLPRPKLTRLMRSPIDETFGLDVRYVDERQCFVVTEVTEDSNAQFAGVTVGSQVVELNGMLLQGVDQDEVYEKMENSSEEMFMLAIDEETESIYREHKVSVNLKNVEGVTDGRCEYRPRLCKLTKGPQGFGFHLLYLEDRKGEYIEEVASGSPASDAGLCIGDRIVEVGGVNIEREKSSDVVKRIRMSGDQISLLVVDPKTDGFYRKKGVTLTASLTVNYYAGRTMSPLPQPRAEKRKNPRDVKPRYCRLLKSEDEDFGLYVVIDNNRIGQVIRWVDCGGPADRAGLRIGDRIIEVNGHSVEYESHQRLISCISLNKTLSQFIVVDEEYDRAYRRNKPRLCRIFKESDSFGFCVCHEQNKDGHYIEEVDEGGPAERAGLKVNDRIIQINSLNVEKDSHENVLNKLRSCESDVVLLVIDSRSNKHYKKIVQFKSQGMKDVDYDMIAIPEEPLFLRDEVDDDDESFASDRISIALLDDHSSMKGSLSRSSVSASMLGELNAGVVSRHGIRECIVRMTKQEKKGFSTLLDRDRNGIVIRDIIKGGPGDRAGMKEGDRIITVNSQKTSTLTHEQVVERMLQSGRKIILTVVDEKSEDVTTKHRPYIFRMLKDEGGYGFYLWHDDNGHYVEEVTIGSPADKSGMRSGDRIIEVNGVNVEEETHEEVFYRVKASMNVVTLLAVDEKTFKLYKKNKIPVSVLKAESNFSTDTTATKMAPKATNTKNTETVRREIELYRDEGEDFGFNLAFSNSFIGDSNSGSHIVHWVEDGGPAFLAGLRDGDRIVEIEGIDVTSEDHDQLITRIYQVGKQLITITIEFEEEQNSFVPHDIKIRKVDNSYGFHLWFDQNGHYIEDVTIGSAADIAGMKTGDRVLKVNGQGIEEDTHADVVNLVRMSGEEVILNVYSVQDNDVCDSATPTVVTITKERGTFGFTLSEDGQGFHFDYVSEDSAADLFGIRIGDRLLEVNGRHVADLKLDGVVSLIRSSGRTVTLSVMSSSRTQANAQESLKSDTILNQIFNELSGKDKIDYVVERRGFQLYGRKNEATEDKDNNGSAADGFDNPVFTQENEERNHCSVPKDLMTKDVKGRFLDENLLPHAISQATMKRRKPGRNIYAPQRKFSEKKSGIDRRKRNLQDIEQKLGHTLKRNRSKNEEERVTYFKDLQPSRTPKEKRFRLVTSKSSFREKWNFEQGDSRQPTKLENEFPDDTILELPEERELDSESVHSMENPIECIDEVSSYSDRESLESTNSLDIPEHEPMDEECLPEEKSISSNASSKNGSACYDETVARMEDDITNIESQNATHPQIEETVTDDVEELQNKDSNSNNSGLNIVNEGNSENQMSTIGEPDNISQSSKLEELNNKENQSALTDCDREVTFESNHAENSAVVSENENSQNNENSENKKINTEIMV
uniref:uncharacterized protein LOC120346265 n=1 Tax=Styela clava TaxID=7725 RepID=UPI00193A67C9|nr:uncharacterized protein LOC120346265 [Styela clava]